MDRADKIFLSGIRCRANIGVPDWERRQPQGLLIDAEIFCDLKPAAKSDDVGLSVNYQEVERLIRRAVQSHPRKLVETLAQDLASAILHSERRAAAVLIRVRKRPKAMPQVGEVAVEIFRQRRK